MQTVLMSGVAAPPVSSASRQIAHRLCGPYARLRQRRLGNPQPAGCRTWIRNQGVHCLLINFDTLSIQIGKLREHIATFLQHVTLAGRRKPIIGQSFCERFKGG